MSNMACLFCSKPIINNEYSRYCIDCDWSNTIRNQALQELFFYMEEEETLKKRLRDIKKRKKEAEKNYNEIWDKFEQQNLGR